MANITDFYSVEISYTGFEKLQNILITQTMEFHFIRCKNIRDNYFDEDDLTYISEEVYNIFKKSATISNNRFTFILKRALT